MKRIQKDNWFIKDNEINISLLRFHTSINILKNDDYVFFHVKVVDEYGKELKFNFYTLEDAIYFTENVVVNCWDAKEVQGAYDKLLSKEIFKEPVEAPFVVENNTLFMNSDEIKQAIVNYYGEGKDNISVSEEVSLNEGKPEIAFYKIEHYDLDGIKKDIETRLTEGDLKNVFNDMLKSTNYEVTDFRYIGGIHRVGYYFDHDTPYFEGIKMNVKEKELSKQKVLEKELT